MKLDGTTFPVKTQIHFWEAVDLYVLLFLTICSGDGQ